MKEALIKAVIQDRRDEGYVENKIDVTNEMREFRGMLNEFEATYSLEELFAIVDLSADPDRKHPLRDIAKKALNPINEFRMKYISEGDDELNRQWKKISNAVGIISKGIVDHNR